MLARAVQTESDMGNELSAWDDVRRFADELELKIHLAGMDARDRWHALEPRLEQLEQQIMHSGDRVEEAVVHELHEVREALRALHHDLWARARADRAPGS